MPKLLLAPPAPVRPFAPPRALSLLAPLFLRLDPFASHGDALVAVLARDLAFALAELSSGTRPRAVVSTQAPCERPGPSAGKSAGWQIGLSRQGDALLVAVFRPGARPFVAQAARVVALPVARQAVLDAIDVCADDDTLGARDGLALAREQLRAAPYACAPALHAEVLRCAVRSERTMSMRLEAEFELCAPVASGPSDVSRADLHALLFEGDLWARVGACERRLSRIHPFLVAEALVAQARDLHTAAASGKSLSRRADLGRSSCAVELHAGQATVELSQGASQRAGRLAPVPVEQVCLAVASFARALVRRLCRVDPSQAQNLRLQSLSDAARDLRRLLFAGKRRSRINRAPASYRACADDTRPPPQSVSDAPAGKRRFCESWRAEVPGIELSSLHLCGPVLVCAGAGQLACLERASGQMVWTRPARRGVSIATPAGLARLSPDGRLSLHELSDGQLLFELRLGPCSGARATGAIVSGPGLPQLLLLAEGEKHVCAVDLACAEVRWRRAIHRRGRLRLRRAGRLVIASAAGPELCAIDVSSGEVVWRHCAPGRFAHACALDGHQLFVVSTAARSSARGEAILWCLDAWTGEERWCAPLPRAVRLSGAPIAARDTIAVITDDGRDAIQLGVCAFDTQTGRLRYDAPGGLCAGQAARLSVDDLLIANSASGELCAFDLPAGRSRYRHVFAAGRLAGDRPRKLEPVLRSGALFVPQSEIFAVRPADGTLVGRIATEIVPDAMRVDERCGVYVAEASGYLAAYQALPMLSLVEQG